MTTNYCTILTTVSDVATGDQITDALLSEQLAACIQVLPIQSHYVWQGKRQQDSEQLMLIKTRSNLYPAVEACIRKIHPYEVPEIIRIPIDQGFAPYLNWIQEVTTEPDVT